MRYVQWHPLRDQAVEMAAHMTYREVAEALGLGLNTVARWYDERHEVAPAPYCGLGGKREGSGKCAELRTCACGCGATWRREDVPPSTTRRYASDECRVRVRGGRVGSGWGGRREGSGRKRSERNARASKTREGLG